MARLFEFLDFLLKPMAKRSVTVERRNGNYELVIRIPIAIETGEGGLVVRESELPEFCRTNREQQVLGLLVLGRRNKEIASALNICERTIKFHVSSLLAKAGCKSRIELALKMRQAKLSENDFHVRP
jgi:DNA-binding CsgD family transcriptional regulator